MREKGRKLLKKMKEDSFFHGIRFRISIGLVLIFLITGLLLGCFIKHRMKDRIKNQITENMQIQWQNSDAYARQLLLINHNNNDEEGFKEIWGELKQNLRNPDQKLLWAYDNIAVEIQPDEEKKTKYSEQETELFKRAVQGEASYWIRATKNSSCYVTFVYPVMVEGKQVGIIRMDQDYGKQQEENNAFVKFTFLMISVGFFMALILCGLLFHKIWDPLFLLSGYSVTVADKLQQKKYKELPLLDEKLLARQDEISEVARNYDQMLAVIEKQFKEIEEDKAKILRLLQDRQVFFDNVTHELKTPLTTIQGYTQLLQTNKKEDADLFETGIKTIGEESHRLYQMVTKLLDLSNIRPIHEKKVIDLSDILLRAATVMNPKAWEQDVSIIVEGRPNCRISGVEDEILEVITNLIDNGLKYGSNHVPLLISCFREEKKIYCSVVNQGRGIKREEQDKIFDAFYRVDKEYSRKMGSAGLGLAICKKIVEAHGGEIRVESEPGRETTFVMCFEAWEEET